MGNENGELPSFEFDGLTTELPAPFSVTPGETYHIKLAIADVGDSVLDSGVFIGIESLCGSPELKPPAIIEVEQDGATVVPLIEGATLGRATSVAQDQTPAFRFDGTSFVADVSG